MKKFIKKLIEQKLLLFLLILTIISSLLLNRLPKYSLVDAKVIFTLFTLFVLIKGLENSNLFDFIANKIKINRILPAKLILFCVILSMFATNDVALIVIVPFTLKLKINRKDFLIILETLAVNAGSVLTPFGNPQNILIYMFYDLSPKNFFITIYPFVTWNLFVILVLSFFINPTSLKGIEKEDIKVNKKNGIIFCIFLLIFILSILKILPILIGIPLLIAALFLDFSSFKVDYILLGIFLLFFGLTDNLSHLIPHKIQKKVFWSSSIISQIISNVPTTLLFLDFTHNWKSLLVGVSVGGYGTLIASLANLISYRYYVLHYNSKAKSKEFLLKFHILSFGMLFFCYFLRFFRLI